MRGGLSIAGLGQWSTPSTFRFSCSTWISKSFPDFSIAAGCGQQVGLRSLDSGAAITWAIRVFRSKTVFETSSSCAQIAALKAQFACLPTYAMRASQ